MFYSDSEHMDSSQERTRSVSLYVKQELHYSCHNQEDTQQRKGETTEMGYLPGVCKNRVNKLFLETGKGEMNVGQNVTARALF